jgi:hypothetical protein
MEKRGDPAHRVFLFLNCLSHTPGTLKEFAAGSTTGAKPFPLPPQRLRMKFLA